MKPWFVTESEQNVAAIKAGRPQGIRRFPVAWSTPLYSRAMSVHSSQAKEFNAAARAGGVTGVYYDDKGGCHFESRAARKAEMKRRGCFDRDAGYGDAN